MTRQYIFWRRVVIVVVLKRFQEKSLLNYVKRFKLSNSEQDIFLMAQLKAMNGREITASRRLKKKTRANKRTFYYGDRNTPLCQKTYLNMLGIGRTHFENVRNHLATNGIIPRIHGNIKRMPRWKTKITIDIAVATAVKNFTLKSMDYQVRVETSIALLNRLHYCQLKRVINQS